MPALQARFPGTSQVVLLGLERASDAQLCGHAAEHGFVVRPKGDDFHRLVAARGCRPQLIHLAIGNALNDVVQATSLAGADRIEAALSEPGVGVVVLE